MNLQILQPTHLANETVTLKPLEQTDFNLIYKAASDPLIWEQYPTPTRYKLEVFENYFEGAMQSKGAFAIIHNASKEYIGCTRFYDLNLPDDKINIGYTFITRPFWGKGINAGVKRLMLNYIFNYVRTVQFYVGSKNIRSQMALDKIGAVKVAEENISYFGEAEHLNYIYQITKASWVLQQ